MRDPFLNPGFPALCERGDKEAAAGCFSQHKPIPWKWLQDPPRLYLPEELVGLSREGAELPCLPMLLGWRVWHSSWQGLFSAPPALRSGHKQPLSTSSPLPKSGGKERRPWLSHRHPTVPHTGRSPLLLAPRRSLLIQSQHNGAEMAPLILLGRRSRYMVGISNDFLPHGTGSQDLALCTAPQ